MTYVDQLAESIREEAGRRVDEGEQLMQQASLLMQQARELLAIASDLDGKVAA